MIHKTIQPKREGVILLIVMAMLALFASVGLTFVFYAESEAKISSTAREGETFFRADVEPELLLNHVLGQMIHDSPTEYSSLLGTSLGRDLYGEDPSRTGRNGVPFNGVGVLNYAHTHPDLNGVENRRLVNKIKHAGENYTLLPEHYGVKEAGRFVGGRNAPWTYPGLDHPYLAAVNAAGEVLRPSFAPAPELPTDTDTVKRHLTFRPHPSYHFDPNDPTNPSRKFPPSLDGGPDVKNLPFGPGTRNPVGGYWPNDSYWMYTGFPVLTAANGKKYTVLFAPLIMDLDNRVNLLVHGNIRGPGDTHVSHQGWGRWEVNPFHAGSPILGAGDLVRLFKHPTFGRYGPDGFPTGPLDTRKPPPYYSLFDFDAVLDPAGGRMTLPPPNSFSIFPRFPGPGWDSGNTTEVANHPARARDELGSHPSRHPSHMEAALRGMGKGSPALTSDLFKWLPATMSDLKRRNLVTLLSRDFDRAGMLPFLTDGASYKYRPKLGYPELEPAPLAFPDPANPPPGGDFDGPLFASKLGALKRLNLNRDLPNYPLPVERTIADPDAFSAAQLARQKLAKDNYDYLRLATGCADPNGGAVPKDSDQFRAARWLAQLAANMVDYIDNDDYMTPFQWYRNPEVAEDFEMVFGTELPRLVINEAYAHLDVSLADPKIKAKEPLEQRPSFYRMSVWVELFNVSRNAAGSPYPLENGKVRIAGAPDNPYRLVLTKPDARLHDPDFELGKYDPEKSDKVYNALQATKTGKTIVDDLKDPIGEGVQPGEGLFRGPPKGNEGFYVVGPEFLAGDKSELQMPESSETSKGLVAKLTLEEARPNPTILLQRLACPHLPHDPILNPYLTVDFAEDVHLNDMRTHTDTGMKEPAAINTAYSVGRRQPHAARRQVPQNPDDPPATSPKHTLFRQNSLENEPPIDYSRKDPDQTLDQRFEWLTHLDRQLINPMEILHVSSVAPHLLTQKFITPEGVPFQHYAPWRSNEKSLLYRFLAMAHTPDLFAGQPVGGRIPGMININTVWDEETFKAICDWNGLSGFTETDVVETFRALRATRTLRPDGIVSENDRPFMPFSVGVTAPGTQYPQGAGIKNTLFRPRDPNDPTSQPLFQVPNKLHPYEKLELLTKIYNTLTTRSNVFAVWVTAGFFEVTDDSVSPPRIGREIGKDDNREIRHKFFAIVDRTELKARISANGQVDGPERPYQIGVDLDYIEPAVPGDATIVDKSQANLEYTLLSGQKFTVVPGTYVTIAPDTVNEETVAVKAVNNGNTFTFPVTKAHGGNDRVIFRSWPGPWPRYDVRRDEKVVPYFTVID